MCEKFIKLSCITSVICLLFVNVAAYADDVKTTTDTVRQSTTTEEKTTTTNDDNLPWQTLMTITDPSKYGDHFKCYDYVNPDAPKGGTLNMVSVGDFDSLNPYLVQGTPPEGMVPIFGGMIYDTLMSQSLDQGGIMYPLVADKMRYPKDDSWVEYHIDPKAHFNDGTPITVEDVIWTFNTLNKYSPFYKAYYTMVDKAYKVSDSIVRFDFKIKYDRELPGCLGDMVVLPKHFWEGKDANGNKRDFSRPTLEIPLGSGPYEIESFQPGKQIIWRRVKNYWAKDLPINVGRNNYDRVKYNYVRDENAQWEAFKKGGLADYREEKVLNRWEDQYDFTAVRQGKVKKITYPNIDKYSPGFYFNTRRAKFADVRVREALFLAFDFTVMNRDLFYNQNERVTQYYNTPELMFEGLPQGQELELLNQVRDLVPSEVFTKEYKLPSYDTPKEARDNLEKAMDLLNQAGYHLSGTKLVDKNGKQFHIEILISTPLNEPFTAFYAANLRKLGIDVAIRRVDNAQYVNRRSTYDYDVIYEDVAESNSPGNEQLSMFASALADTNGTLNYAGVKNPAIDKLINLLIHVKDRAGVIAASKAINRVLVWNYYRVPSWRPKTVDIAHWEKVSFPPTQPHYKGFDFLSGWINPSAQNNQKQTK